MADDASSDRRRLIRAFLLAPLTAPAVYAAALIVVGVVRSIQGRGSFSVGGVVAVLGLVAMVGVPVAYVATLAAGLPMYLLLRRLGMVSGLVMAIVGATIGVAAAIIIQPQVRGEMISFPFPIWVGAVLGLLSAEVFRRLTVSSG